MERNSKEMEQHMFLENDDEEDTRLTQKSWRNISTHPLFLKDVKLRIWEMKKPVALDECSSNCF